MTVAVAGELKEQGRGVGTTAAVTDELLVAPPDALRVVVRPRHDAAPATNGGRGRQRRVEQATNRVRRDGKFFRLGDEKFFVKGVTYGPFALNADGDPYPSLAQTRDDFEQILSLGANCVRVYHTPPHWFKDLAHEMGLKIFLDVAWPKNLTFVDDPEMEQRAVQAVG